MTKEIKVLLSIGLATVILLVGSIFFLSKSSGSGLSASVTIPPEQRNLLVRDNSWKTSSASANVTIVEFSDFQCPACGAAFPVVKKIEADYGSKVNFVYRHFPLPQHKNGFKAALAAEAAGEQGKFWEMHDKLFVSQDKWGELDNPGDTFTGYAKDLGLETPKFQQDLNDKKLADKINQDQADGTTLGVNSTPTFFINNQKFPGVLNYEEFKSKIDSELNK